jgi:hypothetical protein
MVRDACMFAGRKTQYELHVMKGTPEQTIRHNHCSTEHHGLIMQRRSRILQGALFGNGIEAHDCRVICGAARPDAVDHSEGADIFSGLDSYERCGRIGDELLLR